MGQRASQVGAMNFDAVTVPHAALLGPKGRGFHIMMSVLEKGRVGIAALAVGTLGAWLERPLRPAEGRWLDAIAAAHAELERADPEMSSQGALRALRAAGGATARRARAAPASG